MCGSNPESRYSCNVRRLMCSFSDTSRLVRNYSPLSVGFRFSIRREKRFSVSFIRSKNALTRASSLVITSFAIVFMFLVWLMNVCFYSFVFTLSIFFYPCIRSCILLCMRARNYAIVHAQSCAVMQLCNHNLLAHWHIIQLAYQTSSRLEMLPRLFVYKKPCG